jgi:ubiquinone/menaquinone biosynthesis C-methylase UbiE
MLRKSKITDQEYLCLDQYRTAANLTARNQFYSIFGNDDWHNWLFRQIVFRSPCDILEVGCGAGKLWSRNLDHISSRWNITLSDMSSGMVIEARNNLRREEKINFHFISADVQALPFPSKSFDIVIANHMLYHVPNLEQALANIHTVLRSGGHLYTSTSGASHLKELDELVTVFDPNLTPWGGHAQRKFIIQNGEMHLSKMFSGIQFYPHPGNLTVTQAKPLMAYILSTPTGALLDVSGREDFLMYLESMLIDGPIIITREEGLFVSVKR